MKVINYTALIKDSIYKQKAAEKSLKLSSRIIKFKSTAKNNFSNQLFFVMKVINYTALEIREIKDSIYKQKAAMAKKASNSVPESSNSRDIRIFFVNSRSVKSVRRGKNFSCRPFRKREKN